MLLLWKTTLGCGEKPLVLIFIHFIYLILSPSTFSGTHVRTVRTAGSYAPLYHLEHDWEWDGLYPLKVLGHHIS